MFKSIRQPFFNADGDVGGEVAGNDSASSSTFEGSPRWGIPDGNQAAGKNPLFSTPAEAPAQPAQASAAQVFDFAGRKIEVTDPNMAAALQDVHKDYAELNRTYTQTNQRVKELEQTAQTYLSVLQSMPQTAQPNNAQPQQSQPTPEDLEQMKSDFMEKFYDNPVDAIEGMLDRMFEQKVQPMIEPITQEQQWNKQVRELQTKYEDFQTMTGPMHELLQEMPHLAEHGLEGIYHLAKRMQPQPQPGPEQLLNDPNFVSQFMQKPEIQQQFLSQYLQEKQASQQQAPTVMSGQPGGTLPTSPESRPKDLRSATHALKRHLGIG